jgi:hypothetical protein
MVFETNNYFFLKDKTEIELIAKIKTNGIYYQPLGMSSSLSNI